MKVSGANRKLDTTYWTSCDIDIEINDEWLIFSNDSSGLVRLPFCPLSFKYKDKDGYRNFADDYKNKILNEINIYFNKPLINYSISNGVLKNYYPNGQIEFELTYKKGERNGVSKYYYPNGKLNGIDYYKNGKLEGVQKLFYLEGGLNFYITKHYKNGIEVDSTNFYDYSADSGKYYLSFTSFRDKSGQFKFKKIYKAW